ncbi:MAG: hypothetical protein PHQ75_01825 [Thermoguttaceae bacterium]|nr:hypothetical protein [Thermoguttaceae bacterium]
MLKKVFAPCSVVVLSVVVLFALIPWIGCSKPASNATLPAVNSSALAKPVEFGNAVDSAAVPVASKAAAVPANEAAKPADVPAPKKSEPAASSELKSAAEKPAAQPASQPQAAVPVKEIETRLKEFNSLAVSTEELTSDEARNFDTLAASLKALKEFCKSFKLKPVLSYTPFFEAKEAKFLVREKEPWHWEFCVQKNMNEIRDCVDLNMTGDVPVVSVTKEGRWRFPETVMIPFAVLSFSLVDSANKPVSETAEFSMLKPQKVNASVYFPDGSAPQFLERMFDLNLITSAGQIAFSGGANLFVQPMGKKPIPVPILEYYKKKKEEKEKERGAAFGATVGPSPQGESIGTVVYWDVNENHLSKLGVSDKNDIGYDFYLENTKKQKITIYEARP